METVRYIYNGANQVACIDADANGTCNGTEFWVYDAHGNLTFDRTTRYVYDAANHLKTVCDSGDGLTCDALGNETTYQYNGDGARVAQSVRKGILPATVTTYTLDVNLPLTQVLSETTSGQTTRYLHGHDLIAQSDGTSTEYLAYDGLGSVRQLIDGSGAVLTSQTFDPYGTPYSVDEQADSSFGFTGEQTDENGLVYLRARYYNPAQGRFMQVDPSRMERNGYQYAGSSPGMYADPSGKCYGWATFMWDIVPDYCRQLDTTNEILSNPSLHTRAEVGGAFNFAALSVAAAPVIITAGAVCIAGFEVCGPALAAGGEFLAIFSSLYSAEVSLENVASNLFGTAPPSPADLQAAQDIFAGNMIGWQAGLWQQPVGPTSGWQLTQADDAPEMIVLLGSNYDEAQEFVAGYRLAAQSAGTDDMVMLLGSGQAQGPQRVLILGEAQGSPYAQALARAYPDWEILGTQYGTGTNTQVLLESPADLPNLTLLDDVNATQLGAGSFTGSGGYDAIVFNGPRAEGSGWWKSGGDLVRDVLNSSRSVLTPNGYVRFSSSGGQPSWIRLSSWADGRYLTGRYGLPPGYSQPTMAQFLGDPFGLSGYRLIDNYGVVQDTPPEEFFWFIFSSPH